MQYKTIILIGPQGSGKGTQATLIQKYIERERSGERVFYVETGKKFRELMEQGNYTAQVVKDMLSRGEKPPEFLAVWLWGQAFVENLRGEEHLIIDGFPRTRLETEVFDGAVRFYPHTEPYVIHLALSDDVARERLVGRGRFDDTEESITARLQWYRQSVAPVLEYFQDSKDYTFIEIDGSKTIEEIHDDIINAVFSS